MKITPLSSAVNSTIKEPTAYQLNLAQPENDKWYKGDQPTSREIYGRIYELNQRDPAKAKIAAEGFAQDRKKSSSPYYAPYEQITNKAVSNLNSYGIDTSVIDDDFYTKNSYLNDYLIYDGTTNAPSKPGKNATPQQLAAYEFYQVGKGREITSSAHKEWAALQEEIDYLTNSPMNYSDDEIYNKIYGDSFQSKYPTLYKMDQSLEPGNAILELNSPIEYSKDNVYTAIWRARNDGGTGNMAADTALSAAGKGNSWKDDPIISAKRDWNDKNTYKPYALGMTMEDAGAYFGVYEFTQDTIDELRKTINPNDKTSVSMFNKV